MEDDVIHIFKEDPGCCVRTDWRGRNWQVAGSKPAGTELVTVVMKESGSIGEITRE